MGNEIESKMDLLHRKKIIYKGYPDEKEATSTYEWGWFYEEGTYDYFNLFNTKHKITTYAQLFWYLSVLRYLNPLLDENKLSDVAKIISNPSNGFMLFKPIHKSIENMVNDVLNIDSGERPKNRIKKVIFKDFCGLTANEKISISNKIINQAYRDRGETRPKTGGRKKQIDASTIYEAMLLLNDQRIKITTKHKTYK